MSDIGSKAPSSGSRSQRIRELFDLILDLDPEEQALRLDEVCQNEPDLCSELSALLGEFWAQGRDISRVLDRLRPEAGHEEVEQYLEKAIALDPDACTRYLQSLTGLDDSLGDLVDQLLAAQEKFPENFDSMLRTLFKKTSAQKAENYNQYIGEEISRYRIVQLIGRGGMGVVFKAVDETLGRHVAIKILNSHLAVDEVLKKRFSLEAVAASRINHTNIGYVHEIDELEDGRMYIVMAYYEGETLRVKMARGSMPIPQALDYAIQIARGLHQVHKQEIIHRDIKPANVIITPEGVAKIIDFGLVKMNSSDLTQAGWKMGTVSYMSPEQARGDDVDHRTDLWSLGVVLYEMLYGQRPFRGAHDQAVIYSILNTNPFRGIRSMRGDLEEIHQLLKKLLQKNPEERYADASQLVEDLETIRKRVIRRTEWDSRLIVKRPDLPDEPPADDGEEEDPDPAPEHVRFKNLGLIVAIVLALTLAVVLFVYLM